MANLQEANLQKAKLQGADLQGANLQDADLQEAKLQGANLHGANLRGTKLCGADLSDAILSGVTWEGADLREVDLSAATLEVSILILFSATADMPKMSGEQLTMAYYVKGKLFKLQLLETKDNMIMIGALVKMGEDSCAKRELRINKEDICKRLLSRVVKAGHKPHGSLGSACQDAI